MAFLTPTQESAAWSFDIRLGAEAAGHSAILLAAFALTIIVLFIGASDMRRDPLAPFIVRPFLPAFIGNMIAAFQFMMVQSDTTLSERTFALIVPPEFLTIISTAMMLFGINLAVCRYFSDARLDRIGSTLFLIAGLYTIGVVHRGFSDLYHVHEGHAHISLSVLNRAGLLVWGPGLLVVLAEFAVDRRKWNIHYLHDLNMWWCSGAIIVAIVTFGATLLMESEDKLHGALLPWCTLLVASSQWLVLGTCFYLLRKFPGICRATPLTVGLHAHGHPPHPPM